MTQQKFWTVYFLRCIDNSLYTGITIDIERRLHQHNNTKLGAKYTRARRPVKLVYSETAVDKSAASKREYQLRTLTKKKKEELVLANLVSPASN
jgi:putative endonuclease